MINLAVLDTIMVLAGLEPRELPASEILQTRKDQLVSLLPDWEGAEHSGIFAENFFMDNRLSDVVERTRQLYDEVGSIERVGEIQPLNQLRGTFVLEGERKNIEVFFTLSPEKEPLIQQVRMWSLER
jgi:hypothetical protein